MLKMVQPMMQLRKIVNHPYLVHFPLVPGGKELRVDEELVNKSGKLLVLDAMLVKLKQRGHKVH
jgi:ATP-dependent DNA helicase